MARRSLQLVAAARSTGSWAGPGAPEPTLIVARHAWHGQQSVEGDGYLLRALNLAVDGAPARIGIRPIPLVGAGAGVLDVCADGSGVEPSTRPVLRFEFARPSLVHDFDLGLLFDGPDYADWAEAARFDVWFAGERSPRTFTLHTSYVSAGFASSSWDGSAVPWLSSGAWSGGPGLWLNADPFGGRTIERMDLHAERAAADATPRGAAPRRTERSNCVFRALRAVPMPDAKVLARLGDGLAGDLTRPRRA